ncbi:MAG: hypothetical protein IJL38_03575 [Bacteroidales bacterium]|nr:hypothetical protein [Bacteroidales bacterium]
MKHVRDINEDEIRVVGGKGGRRRPPRWLWFAIAGIFLIVVIAVLVVLLLRHGNAPEPPVTDTVATLDSVWLSNTSDDLPSCTLIADTVIDTLPLTIYTPYNAVPELHVGNLDTTDSEIVFAAMAADLRKDNGKIVGAFVLAGEPLSWGLSKRGYCAILDNQITIGTAENSPLFEQATEQGGYFFRQYPAVEGGQMVHNNPQNAAPRRALCTLNGNIVIVSCNSRVLMDTFSQALVSLGVSDAILLVGGTAEGWCRTADGNLVVISPKHPKSKKYTNHIVFRRQ